MGTDPLIHEMYAGLGEVGVATRLHAADFADSAVSATFFDYLSRASDLIQVGAGVAIVARNLLELGFG
jgi:hypothetical protein